MLFGLRWHKKKMQCKWQLHGCGHAACDLHEADSCWGSMICMLSARSGYPWVRVVCSRQGCRCAASDLAEAGYVVLFCVVRVTELMRGQEKRCNCCSLLLLKFASCIQGPELADNTRCQMLRVRSCIQGWHANACVVLHIMTVNQKGLVGRHCAKMCNAWLPTLGNTHTKGGGSSRSAPNVHTHSRFEHYTRQAPGPALAMLAM